MPRILPRFIKRDGDPQIPPPYMFKDVTIRHFRLMGTKAKLQDLVDKHLNLEGVEQRVFKFKVNGSEVDLDVLTYKRMESDAEGYKNLGYTTQNELYFRITVDKFENKNGTWVPDPQGAMFVPYIFVDNNWSVISGREVIGYPKVPAFIKIPTAGDYPISIITDVFEQFEPNKPQTPARTPDGKEGKELVKIVASGGAAAARRVWLSGQEIPQNLPAQGKKEQMSIIQLKQFLDAKNHDGDGYERACYQALVTAEIEVSYNITSTNPDPIDPARIMITDFASMSIANKLGLGGNPLNPIWEGKMVADFKIHKTQNLVEFP